MAAIFSKVSEQYGELVNFIIRPPRDNYSDADLGPALFSLAGKTYKRTDLELLNRRNNRLQCSHFEPVLRNGVTKKLPCVIYLHGNCSSRVEALSALPVLLPQNITVFAFDFSGSGKSDGPYISLGWWERDDLDTVIEHLRSTGNVSAIGLWGRSMGAVTALMHAHRDPSIGGMVLDSPFAALRRLAEELADVVLQFTVPKFVLSILLGMVRSSIISKAQFDINNIAPINHVSKAYIPALFVYGREDSFISPQHVKDLHEAYKGDKNLIEVEGGHNSPRPAFMLHSCAIFFRNTLNPLALSNRDGEDGGRTVGDGRDRHRTDSTDSSSPSSDISSADIVIPLDPFEGTPIQSKPPSAPTAAAEVATGACALRPLQQQQQQPQQQQQQQQEQQHAGESPQTSCGRLASAESKSASGLPHGDASSTATSSSSSKRRPWHVSSSGSSSSSKHNGEVQGTQREEQQPVQRRGSLLPRGLLRWGSSKSRGQTAASADARNSSSTRVVSNDQAPQPCTATPADGAVSAEAPTQGASRAPGAASPTDAVRAMAPPVPSFCFFNYNSGIEPMAFIEDEDEILQRAISISLEEFIKEQQAAAEAASKRTETPRA